MRCQLEKRQSPILYNFDRGESMNKVIRLAFYALANTMFALVLTACATSPLGRSQLTLFSEDAMAEMGATAFQDIKSKEKSEPNVQILRYVSCVADHVVAALPADQRHDWEVRVFADDELNAFALPGRKIGVYDGMLKAAQNQHQLATVIGHEVAHVLAQHGNERISTNFAAETGLQIASAFAGNPGSAQSQTIMALLGVGTQVGVLLPFSRAQESEADILGLDLMASAGFEPAAGVELWQNMAALSEGKPPEFLSTHPGTNDRISALRDHLPQATRLQQTAHARGIRPNCRS
jgi:predicted Zn-dependent protease